MCPWVVTVTFSSRREFSILILPKIEGNYMENTLNSPDI
jgi:hypothetical protein